MANLSLCTMLTCDVCSEEVEELEYRRELRQHLCDSCISQYEDHLEAQAEWAMERRKELENGF